MPTPFPLEIVTLRKVAFAGTAERVSVTGGDGSLAVEARHAPLVTNVIPGQIIIRGANGAEDLRMAVGEGFLLVVPSGTTLLVDSAERPEEIDVGRARAAHERAEHWLAGGDPEVDRERGRRALARAKARLRVALGE